MVVKDPIDTKEAGEILGVEPSRVRQLILAEELRAQKVGRDHVIDRSDVLALKDRREKQHKAA